MKYSVKAKLLSLGLCMTLPFPVFADINVFACEPEWASLAEEIGGDKVEVFTATTANQDPHHIRARPSLLASMRRANLVICSGASLEVGWLPLLLQRAGRPEVQLGAIGNLMAASVVPVLDKPVSIDRSGGDIHPEGNPHVHLNPHNIALVAKALVGRMVNVDPPNASIYQAQYEAFIGRWDAALTTWETEAAELKGVPVIVHHTAFTYLLDWLDLRAIASLEAKPGIPPTTAHLESLLQMSRVSPAEVIIRTPYDPVDASEWLAEKTAIPAVMLPYTIGGNDEVTNLFSLFDQTIALLQEAHHVQQ